MRAIGLIGLLLALAVVAMLTMRQSKAPVAVPSMTSSGETTVVPAHQAASQVQAEVNALVQQQAQQLTNALGSAASAAER